MQDCCMDAPAYLTRAHNSNGAVRNGKTHTLQLVTLSIQYTKSVLKARVAEYDRKTVNTTTTRLGDFSKYCITTFQAMYVGMHCIV
jgi:hypothetical protein